ncbi:hypothetical protein BJ508DRAFT_209320 [Ascobolus immersus RN42]|uniref:Cellular morphogenesis protein n=1 Tax=Ascobolus immersus RN42 TaxID=1160509 RepID=A0A3N4I757_ASCIM|nr:hypothetical protein BJ508DRAFT_209320 [Ascobolus immersus RN42]
MKSSWLSTLIALPSLLSTVHSLQIKTIPDPALNLNQLGRIGIAGDFDAISFYEYEGQDERSLLPSGSHSIFARHPDGGFVPLVSSDASISAACTYDFRNGTTAVVVGGNFTSLGSVPARGIALFDPNSRNVTSLPGLNGKVSALLCDRDVIYVGGEFRADNASTNVNAMTWDHRNGWRELPFEGFNGAVKSIIKSDNQTIVFGGAFTGVGKGGNTTTGGSDSGPDEDATKRMQIINLQGANVGSERATTEPGFGDASKIICSERDGPGETWLMEDGAYGALTATTKFGFVPKLLRLRNTKIGGRSTTEFRFTALPLTGILNMTYIDPETKEERSCESRCPLRDDNEEWQEFKFVNNIGMDAFRIDISGFKGPGGGLSGLEIYSEQSYTFADSDINAPRCKKLASPSNSTTEGVWTPQPKNFVDSNYLSVELTESQIQAGTHSVTFLPEIRKDGGFNVLMFTPGCINDGTCQRRGKVEIEAQLTEGGEPLRTIVSQTNDFDKFDVLFSNEKVDAPSGDFRPSVKLSPAKDQSGFSSLIFVAHKVRFDSTSSSEDSGLNGIYEYNPSVKDAKNSDSVITTSGSKLSQRAKVETLALQGSNIFVGGQFSSNKDSEGYNSIFEVQDNGARTLKDNGLNGNVLAILAQGDVIYLGGNFTNTQVNNKALNRVAAFNTKDSTWSALGDGLNGPVTDIVSFKLNVTDKEETAIAFSGAFTEIRGSGGKNAAAVGGLAVWIPSKNGWLSHIDSKALVQNGSISAMVNYDTKDLFIGSLPSTAEFAWGAVELEHDDDLDLQPYALARANGNRNQKRAIAQKTLNGVVNGAFYNKNDKNLTILAGRFTAQGANGVVHSLAIIDGNDGDKLSGLGDELGSNGTFYALHVPDSSDKLFAGGSIQGTIGDSDVAGLIIWDVEKKALAEVQPSALQGNNVLVHEILSQPGTENVFIGGSFDSAGSLSCPGVCIYDYKSSQWNRPASGLSGSVSAMKWVDKTHLLVAGNMTANETTTYLAIYDTNGKWNAFPGKSSDLPGPVKAMCLESDKADTIFVTGNSTQGETYLMKWTGKEWKDFGSGLGKGSVINHIQVLPVSESHDANDLLKTSHVLLAMGSLSIGSTTASAALFDGKTWTPFLLAAKSSGNTGYLAKLFSENEQTFKGNGKKLAKGLVILIALAISLALVFLLVLAGILASYIRRRQEGYEPAPQGARSAYEKQADLQDRLPPSDLFSSIGPGGMRREPSPML